MKNHKKNRHQRIAEKAARLAPAEVKAAQAGGAAHGGEGKAHVVGTATAEAANARVSIPPEPTDRWLRTGALDEEFDGRTWFGVRPVLVVILGLSATFIAWIAYLISRQP